MGGTSLAASVAAPRLVDAMRRVESSVAIVTAGRGRDRRGATITTAISLSIRPETMLISLNLLSATCQTIRCRRHFCVNFLKSGQRNVAERFSGASGVQGAERYETLQWYTLETGAPALHGALVSIDCWVEEIVGRHSHAMILGEVAAVALSPTASKPLTYSQGSYR